VLFHDTPARSSFLTRPVHSTDCGYVRVGITSGYAVLAVSFPAPKVEVGSALHSWEWGE
jgi:hypothetical protein